MAGVNGVEIKVGQVWRTRGGALATVYGEDDHPDYPVNITVNGEQASCGRNGRRWGDINAEDTSDDDDDLIELVEDENGFTIWRGGEQPAETHGQESVMRLRDGPTVKAPADKMNWAPTSANPIVAYKVVEQTAAQQPEADSASLAEETLSALGWTFDGRAWRPLVRKPNALDVQVGGTHYKDMTIQPWAAFDSWLSTEQHVGYLLGTAIAYLARFNSKGVGKGGLVDVEKATHTLQRLVEVAKKGSANED